MQELSDHYGEYKSIEKVSISIRELGGHKLLSVFE